MKKILSEKELFEVCGGAPELEVTAEELAQVTGEAQMVGVEFGTIQQGINYAKNHFNGGERGQFIKALVTS